MNVLLLRSINMGSPHDIFLSFHLIPVAIPYGPFSNLSTWDLSIATISLCNTLLGAGLRLEATCSEATCLRA